MAADRRLQDLVGIDIPIVQAPMAGATGSAMAIAVCSAGGLGSLPCAMLEPDQIRAELAAIRAATDRPINLNFFCHTPVAADPDVEGRWRRRLAGHYAELALDPDATRPSPNRAPFGTTTCEIVEEFRPEVVSFHFGLPATDLLERVRATGAKIVSSATTVEEAVHLAEHGCDAVIAQGAEAGGHRGMFLTRPVATHVAVATQVGTIALVPQVVDAVSVPVIAAGGIADGRGITAAFALGASGVQLGTAYLFCPEATISPLHAASLRSAAARETAVTNVFTGRPARAIVNRLVHDVGPLTEDAPPFPLAAGAVFPLRAAAEARGSGDYSSMWSGQAAALARSMPAADLTARLWAETGTI